MMILALALFLTGAVTAKVLPAFNESGAEIETTTEILAFDGNLTLTAYSDPRCKHPTATVGCNNECFEFSSNRAIIVSFYRSL